MKLVAEVGVGTVAAGVAKAHADVVLISGHDGGTGAAPLTSLKHAGAPWELGLAETQQTLLLNGLRDRIVVQADGQLKTGRDVVIAALLGAEEFGFATAPLVVAGCIMMRVCHLDTCPVGIATQNPELRKRFTGKPEFVVNFFEFIAEEVRELPGRAGLPQHRRGRRPRRACSTPSAAVDHWKAARARPGADPARARAARGRAPAQHHAARTTASTRRWTTTLIAAGRGRRCSDGEPVRLELPVRNVNRTVGTMLGYEVDQAVRRRRACPTTPSTSRSPARPASRFGAFLPRGITLRLVGDANDYVGKGLSGGRIVVRPPPAAGVRRRGQHHRRQRHRSTAPPAARSSCAAWSGERFCVRNSGAQAVVEGVGDHGCEYMTGGRVVVLGPTGRNFAAGMSGGIAYVLDLPARTGSTRRWSTSTPLTDDEAEMPARRCVARHQRRDRSAVAAGCSADWDAAVGPVQARSCPRDYKRVLEAARRGRAEGLDPDGTSTIWPRIMEAAHVADPKGFLTHRPRELPAAPAGRVRIMDWREVYETSGRGRRCARQAGRCMDCGIPFCHHGCPLGNLIPEWNDLVWRHDWHEAIERLHATNNFPEFTGRLCPAPCEAACVLGINDDPVTIKQVEVEIIDRAWAEGWVAPQPPDRLHRARRSPSSAPARPGWPRPSS